MAVFASIALSLLGLLAYFTMPREEDPRIKRRSAIFSVVAPGSSPEKINRLYVQPIERHLLRVSELKEIISESRLNVAVFDLQLRDDVQKLDFAWREVERAIAKAQEELPPGTPQVVLDFSVLDVDSIVLALTGGESVLSLSESARDLRDRLLSLPEVSNVRLYGDPGQEVSIRVNESKMFSRGLSIPQVLSAIQQNNAATSAGYFVQGSDRLVLQQDNDAGTIDHFKNIQLSAPGLDLFRLSEIAKIEKSISDPPSNLFRWNGKPAVGVGIILREGLNVESAGRQVSQALEQLKSSLPKNVNLETVAYQPSRTGARLYDLLMSLLQGIALIGIFLLPTIGSRMAAVVTISVPIITLISLFVFFLTGGFLHQISIAAFVISIGQFIDNIIVIVDSVQKRVDEGLSQAEAALLTSRQMRSPMLFATLTAICGFIPMLSAQGPTADFTFSIPLIAVISLGVSYLVAIGTIPAMAAKFIQPRREANHSMSFKIEKLFLRILSFEPKIIFLAISILAALSVSSAVFVQKEFFPESDRNEFLFSIELTESADIQTTASRVGEVVQWLRGESAVENVSSFVGGDAPRFYYNLPRPRQSPQVGQLLVTTKDRADVQPLGLKMEQEFSRRYPDTYFTAHFLQQGPPINAKIEARFFAESDQDRLDLTQKTFNLFRNDPRLRAIRRDASSPLSQLRVEAKDRELSDVGISRADLSQILSFYGSGVPVTKYRFGVEPIPVVVRSENGLRMTSRELRQAIVLRGRSRDFKVQNLARVEEQSQAPVIRKLNGKPYLRVLADLAPKSTFSDVMPDISKKIKRLLSEKKDAYVEFAGDAKGADEANLSILKIVPVAMLLLVGFLLIEFKSFKKVFISMVALPVTVVGVFPGLLIGGQAFGFMSLLGILSLVGIAVNNIILLLDAVESYGSLSVAIKERIRPIVLTTTLTVLGLLPLALEESTLWPPLAWTMISGLIFGTFTTLIFVPTLCRVLLKIPWATSTAAFLILIPFLAGNSDAVAAEYSVDQLIDRATQNPNYQASVKTEDAARADDNADWRKTYMPRLTLGGEVFRRSTEIKSQTPFGAFVAEERNRSELMAQLIVPVFEPSQYFAGRVASRLNLESAQNKSEFNRRAAELEVGQFAIEVLIQKQILDHLQDQIANLLSRRRDVLRLVQRGLASESDLFEIDVAARRLTQEVAIAKERLFAKTEELKVLVNLPDLMDIKPLGLPTKIGLRKTGKLNADIVSQRLLVESIKSKSKLLDYTLLPSVDLFARQISTTGRFIVDRDWSEVGVRLQWEIFSGGASVEKSRSILMESQALTHQTDRAELARTSEINLMFAEVEKKMSWIKEIIELKEKAQKIRRVEEARYREGRVTVRDLVRADNLYLDLDRDETIEALTAALKCMQLRLYLGVEMKASCD